MESIMVMMKLESASIEAVTLEKIVGATISFRNLTNLSL